jgi:hypothetical protein
VNQWYYMKDKKGTEFMASKSGFAQGMKLSHVGAVLNARADDYLLLLLIKN